jgi:hypothetical protein
MDENPYKAPQEEGGPQPPSRLWAYLLDLAKLLLLLLVAIVLVAVLLFVWTALFGPRIGHGRFDR